MRILYSLLAFGLTLWGYSATTLRCMKEREFHFPFPPLRLRKTLKAFYEVKVAKRLISQNINLVLVKGS